MSQPAIERFANEVRTYRDFVHHAPSMLIAERLPRARARLLALYEAALSLPEDIEVDGSERNPRPPQPSWDGFGDVDTYWEVFDPYIHDEPVAGSLSDDILDVYRDVVGGLVIWEQGKTADAAWHWRFLFDVHWGDHAIDALRALHRACKRST